MRSPIRLLTEVHGAIDRRDFAHASGWLEAADGIAAAANIEAAQASLAAARRQADTDAWNSAAQERHRTLAAGSAHRTGRRQCQILLADLARPGSRQPRPRRRECPDLGTRLVAKARRAIGLAQYDAARSWLDEAAAIGFASPDYQFGAARSGRRPRRAAISGECRRRRRPHAGQVGQSDVSAEGRIEQDRRDGWSWISPWPKAATVKDIAVHAASAPGVFEDAAISALSQWRYKPVLRDAKAVAQRARIRIRFTWLDRLDASR